MKSLSDISGSDNVTECRLLSPTPTLTHTHTHTHTHIPILLWLQDYKLVVTGHSLGAGAASILSVLLKPAYPHLRCFAYSPPGCIFRYTYSTEPDRWKRVPTFCQNVYTSDMVWAVSVKFASWTSATLCRTHFYEIWVRKCFGPKTSSFWVVLVTLLQKLPLICRAMYTLHCVTGYP